VSRRLVVLAWHNIEPTSFFHATSPSAARRGFERQIDFLRRWTNVVPLHSALADLAASRPLPPRAVALTFDDGYLDNVTVAAPLLRAADMPATFFLVTGFLSGEERAWWEEVGSVFENATAAQLRWRGRTFDTSDPGARRVAMRVVSDFLKTVDSRQRWKAIEGLRASLSPAGTSSARRFMDWDEAGELLRYGHDIGAHTCGHPILSLEDSSVQLRELAESRQQLAAHFQRPVEVLAYPNGQAQDYSKETLRLVSDAGYAFAVTTRRRLAGRATPPLEVPRMVVTPEMDVRSVLGTGIRAARRAVASWRSRSSRERTPGNR
jgi:peptidoglycan/xylan/chitin deacetylase (PgdA/CDA1 family)